MMAILRIVWVTGALSFALSAAAGAFTAVLQLLPGL
jgi:hypothetical protein